MAGIEIATGELMVDKSTHALIPVEDLEALENARRSLIEVGELGRCSVVGLLDITGAMWKISHRKYKTVQA